MYGSSSFIIQAGAARRFRRYRKGLKQRRVIPSACPSILTLPISIFAPQCGEGGRCPLIRRDGVGQIAHEPVAVITAAARHRIPGAEARHVAVRQPVKVLNDPQCTDARTQ